MNNSGSGVASNHFGIGRLRTWLTQTRSLPLFLITAACLLVQEQFPFSNFPMYSSFSSHTFYVYLADESGRPIPSQTTTGMSTPTLKKVYVTEMRKETQRLHLGKKKLSPEQKAIVGQRLLTSLRTSTNAPNGLSLYEVSVDQHGGNFEKQTVRVAAIP